MAKKFLLTFIGVLTLILPFSFTNAYSANAVTSSFKPGLIISDANFYNGNDMTASEIQDFLDRQVPRCTLGDPGREKGKAGDWGGPTFLAQECLKDAKFNSNDRESDTFCKFYKGKAGESAAQIISRVSEVCGISSKVLLVNLQKEQSLITDNWPTIRMYDIAMGYGCPDSGPDFAPQCDALYYGFFNQVYNAARQMKRYKSDPYFGWFPVLKTTNIQYGVDPACGTRPVYIENHATAALYYYTPYTPHDNLLSGKAYTCARGGEAQINFFNLFNSWFGSPTFALNTVFKDIYSKQKMLMGEPTSISTTVSGGVKQEFQHGTAYWSNTTGASFIYGGIRNYYNKVGTVSSQLGFPVGIETAKNGVATQVFKNGLVYWREEYSSIAVSNGIYNYFNNNGGLTRFGLPKTDEISLDDAGAYQIFEKAIISWGAGGISGKEIRDGIRNAYLRYQGESNLSVAIDNEKAFQDGAYQDFLLGVVHWRAKTSGIPLFAGIRNAYYKYGGLEKIGFAETPEKMAWPGAVIQKFDHESVFWSSSNSGSLVPKNFFDYVENNENSGYVGNPIGQYERNPDGVKITTTEGWLFSKQSSDDYYLVKGGIKNAFEKYGGLLNSGYPISDEEYISDEIAIQRFEKSQIIWTSKTKGLILRDYFLVAFEELGRDVLGVPIKSEEILAGGFARQEFENMTIYSVADSYFTLQGGIRNAYNSQNGISILGVPISNEMINDDGSVVQQFENGQITWFGPGKTEIVHNR